MEAKEYLDIIANEIHRTIVATVDDEGLWKLRGGLSAKLYHSGRSAVCD